MENRMKHTAIDAAEATAASDIDTRDTTEQESGGNQALESFLSRESAIKKDRKTDKKKPRHNLILFLAAAAAVALLAGLVIFLQHSPEPAGSEDLYSEAWTVATVDEAGIHRVEVPTDADGEPRQNGSGTLLSYVPAQIAEIHVENEAGGFTVHAHTEAGQATVYHLEGYEAFSLQTGKPEAVANDASSLPFLTIAGAGKRLADYGLASPRARVWITYTDATVAQISVGDEAAASSGTYVSFGSSDDVFLVDDEAVDSFLYAPTAFISLTITDTPESVTDTAARRITVTGSRYAQPIVLEPNTDPAVLYDYCLTSPDAMFADAVMSADIAGSIRDLYAEEVVAVNTGGEDSESFLAPFGLNRACYAEVCAEYPDTTIDLRASAPDSDGSVFLANLSDGGRVVYKIQLGAVSWANTSIEKLTPDTVLRVSRTAIGKLSLTAGDNACSIDVDTRTQTVPTTEGGSEEVTTTKAYLNGKLLGDDSFTILLQNLTEMKNTGVTDAPQQEALLTIRYTYTTGRADDTVTIYRSDGKSCTVALNGAVIGSTPKAYADALTGNLGDILAGKTPKSL